MNLLQRPRRCLLGVLFLIALAFAGTYYQPVGSLLSHNAVDGVVSSIAGRAQSGKPQPGRGAALQQEVHSSPATEAAAAGDSSTWYQQALGRIRQGEYTIKYGSSIRSYTSPNRAQNLRVRYRGNGFSVTPRVDSPKLWRLDLRLEGIGKGGEQLIPTAEADSAGNAICVNDQTMSVQHTGFHIDYTNTSAGMRQDFIVEHQPAGPNSLRVNLRAAGDLRPIASGSRDVLFVKGTSLASGVSLRYEGLKASDATGRDLPAHVEVNGRAIALVVDDADAVYPVTVDPLATTASWSTESNQIGAAMGVSVASAGDVNGDGYSDLILGADLYDNGQTDEGGVFVYHGSATGPSAVANWTAESDQASAHFGVSVASAGDVNGDGYSDVVVGSSQYDNGQTDEGGAFIFHGSVSGLALAASQTLESDQASAHFGVSVASAGDVNGDGFSDILVGAPDYDNGQIDEGRAYLFHGSASGVATTANWTTESNQNGAAYGSSLAGAGDVNGDGYSDVIVGAFLYDNGQTDEGRAFVYHGSASGLATTANWTAESNQASAEYGVSVSSAGDVNGDGYADVIVGADRFEDILPSQLDEGCIFIYYGASAGLATSPSWSYESNWCQGQIGVTVACAGDVNGDGYSDIITGAPYYEEVAARLDAGSAWLFLGSATGPSATSSWSIVGDQASGFYGMSVAGAGDVNGDGFSDVVVGASGYDNGQSDEGRVWLYRGSAAGLSTTSNWTSEVNQNVANYGASVASVGDLNGDGYSDMVVGAPGYDNGQTDEGSAFVFHGSASGPATTADWTGESNQAAASFGSAVAGAGDVNGDGYADLLVGAPLYDSLQTNQGRLFIYHGSASGLVATPARTLEVNQSGAFFGTSVAGAGDINGDGYSDIIVGADGYDNVLTNEGAAFVYYGSLSGVGTSSDWSATSAQGAASFGKSVAGAGDVNGDGYADVIVGAPYYDNGQTNEGRAFVYHGSDTGLAQVANRTVESDQANAIFGGSVSGAGDVNGDGYSDVIVGAVAYDNGQTDEGRAFVYYGSASGIPAVASWTSESDQAGAYFGISVSGAGDVNGDGYSDVAVGAYLYDNGQTNEGRAFVYHGSASGLSALPDWTAESNQDESGFGISLASAGDVNGDGYSDLIVGSHSYDNGQTDEGRAWLYYGNGGAGMKAAPRQFRKNFSFQVVPALRTHSSGIGLSIFGRTFFGRAGVKAQFEVKSLGAGFNGTGVVETPLWSNVMGQANSGVALQRTAVALARNTSYKWRGRLKYRLSDGAVQPYGRWISQPASALTEAHFRIAGTSFRTDTGWRLISLPLKPEDSTVGALFSDDFGSTPPVYAYVPGTGYVSVPFLTLGSGYWLNFGGGTTIDVAGIEVDSVEKSLVTGWNVIGNPFVMPLPLSELRFTNGASTKTIAQAVAAGWLADGSIYGYPGAGYSIVSTELNGWQAYWINVTGSGIRIIYLQ